MTKLVERDGYDTISGGKGNDKINGGKGDDTINWELGYDTLKGCVNLRKYYHLLYYLNRIILCYYSIIVH